MRSIETSSIEICILSQWEKLIRESWKKDIVTLSFENRQKNGIKISLKVSDILALLPPSLYMPRVTDMQLSSTARVTKQEILYRVRLIFVTLSATALAVWEALDSMDLSPFIAAESSEKAGWLRLVSQTSWVHRTTHTPTHAHTEFSECRCLQQTDKACVCV